MSNLLKTNYLLSEAENNAALKPYYDHAGITIYHGDCTEIVPQLRRDEWNIDSVITDPPYGVGLSAKRAKQRDGGVSVREGSYSFEDTPEYIAKTVVPVIELCRKIAKAVAITPGTRNLWLYPPADDLGCFYSAAGTGLGKWGFTCCYPILYYGSDPFLSQGLGARANSCGQTYPNDANVQAHPCAKPIRMMMWLVNRASSRLDTILDPFMGSGSVILAAKELERRAIGIEIEEKYCEIAANRLSQEVFDFGGGQQ